MSESICVEGLRTQSQVMRITRDLVDRQARQRPVDLDLSLLDREGVSGSRMRISSTWGSVLTNLLLGLHPGTELRVSLPTNHGVLLQLARAGVVFAIAQHPHCTVLGATDRFTKDLDRWREDWQPADPAQTSFFDDDNWASPEEVEPRFLAFLNPDRSPMATGDADRTNAIAPWLHALTRRVLTDPVGRDQLLSDVSMAVNELAENIVYHAKLIDRDSCYVFVYATKGPSGDSANRLSIVAHDTGIGIDATLDPVFDSHETVDAASRVAAPFNGQMPRYGRDRGKGLARVISMARRRGGASVFAATSLSEDPTGAIVLSGRQRGEFVPKRVANLPIKGTIVSVSFKLSFPKSPRSEVRHAQREAARLRPRQLELLGSD